jgi:O-antigen ligase
MLGFVAAFVATSRLGSHMRQWAGLGVACLGAAGALIGLVGLAGRWYPMAIPAQGLWRVATTLTYSDAAGLVLGMCLLLAFGTQCCPSLVRVAVCLNTAGVLATQSRGACLAVICGAVFVPWRRLALLGVPVLAGVTIGVAAIVSSPDPGAVPWLAGVVAAAVGVAAATSWNVGDVRVRGRAGLVLAAVLFSLAALVLIHHEIALRVFAPSDQDRTVEWSTALHQWSTSPIVGVGPDRVLVFRAPDGSMAHFVHNEYLQIAADAGAIGLALLGLSAVSVGRVVRRFDPLASCAVGGLVCWAIAGAFDFDWHLSVVGLLGGWCVGLATPRHDLPRGSVTSELRRRRIPTGQAPMAGASGSES